MKISERIRKATKLKVKDGKGRTAGWDDLITERAHKPKAMVDPITSAIITVSHEGIARIAPCLSAVKTRASISRTVLPWLDNSSQKIVSCRHDEPAHGRICLADEINKPGIVRHQ